MNIRVFYCVCLLYYVLLHIEIHNMKHKKHSFKYTHRILYGDFFNLKSINSTNQILKPIMNGAAVIMALISLTALSSAIPVVLVYDNYRGLKYYLIRGYKSIHFFN